MRIRWKLLIVLLCISLIPILIMRWNGQRIMRKMGDDLATKTRDVIVQKTSYELKIIVEEHSRTMRRERELIELALRVQATELEKRFTGNQQGYLSEQLPGNTQSDRKFSGWRSSKQRSRIMGSGMSIPFTVSYDRQTYRKSRASRNYHNKNQLNLSSMIPVYRSLTNKHPDLIFWQLTALESGDQTIYPALDHVPRMFDALRTEWYQLVRSSNDTIWSVPTVDPFTRQITLVVSAPIKRSNGSFMGATAIVVPVGVILQNDEHIQSLSKNVISMLVRAQNHPDTQKVGLRVVAREHKIKMQHHHWQAPLSEEWLLVEDKIAFDKLVEDLRNQTAGVIEMRYNGVDSLVGYGCIDGYCTALLLIVQKKDIVAEAVAMENYVLNRIGQQIQATGIILLGVILGVNCLALVLSRSITSNIHKLVEVSRRIASGDFKTRAQIKARDEMGELGRAFDQMVPALEEHVKMKQALDVAMEVQQNLLPKEMPKLGSLDIAAKSLYCDETGGDFYDFMDFCCRENDVLGVVIGDVTGHGISAALLMATARALLRCRVTQPGQIVDIIKSVNTLLAKDTADTNQFVTLFYMELNNKDKKIEWIRAGHEPAILYDPSADSFEELRGEGISLGINDGFIYPANVKTGLSQGQIILLGTDGIWETRNSSGEMFGKKRLNELIRRYSHSSANEILNSITDSLEKFRGDAKQEDDVTLVVIKIVH